MIEYIPLAIKSLSTAKDIATSLLELRDFDKIASATIELKSHLIQTYDHIISEKERVFTLQERISELEKECTRLKDWSSNKEKYTRRNIGPGVSAYVENNHQGNFESAHKLCCNCFEKTIPSTLQQSNIVKQPHGFTYVLKCPNGCPNLEFAHYLS